MTGLTDVNRDQSRDDRLQQERVLAALDAAPAQLRRDECGSWVIAGRRGTIQTWGDGKTWLVYVRCRSGQHWTFTKRRLAFMIVTQDGDEEGCLRLVRLPTPQEAVVIREVMGLRKRVAYAPDALERKRASMAKAGLARGPARASAPDLATPDEIEGHFWPQGGPVVERVGREVRSALIATGVSGRFRAQGAASAPGLVPEDLPIASRGNFAAKPSISAGRMTEPEEAK
jgi:hypothetical protein